MEKPEWCLLAWPAALSTGPLHTSWKKWSIIHMSLYAFWTLATHYTYCSFLCQKKEMRSIVGRQHRKPPDFSVLQGCVSNMGFKWVVCVLDVQCGNGSQQGSCKIKWRFLLFKACRPGPSLLMEQCSHLFYETLMLTSMKFLCFLFPPSAGKINSLCSSKILLHLMDMLCNHWEASIFFSVLVSLSSTIPKCVSSASVYIFTWCAHWCV